MSAELLSLAPGRPDAELAKELRVKVVEALEPTLAVLNEARRLGFGVTFQLGADFLGKVHITSLTIVKEF